MPSITSIPDVYQPYVKALAEKWHSGEFRTRKLALKDLLDDYPELKKAVDSRYCDFNSFHCTWNGYLRAYDPTAGQGDREQLSMEADMFRTDYAIDTAMADMPDGLADLLDEIQAASESTEDDADSSADPDPIDPRLILEQRDRKRLEVRSFRNEARLDNAWTAYRKAMLAITAGLGDHLSSWEPRKTAPTSQGAELVLHLTDVHFNELINLPGNKYDFRVASRRLQKLAAVTKLHAVTHGAHTVHVAIGGDLINSDRRPDEVLSQATNRAQATTLGALLVFQFIADLRESLFVHTHAVPGNEGRLQKELGFTAASALYSFDAQCYDFACMLLRQAFPGDDGLVMHSIQPNESIFKVKDQTFLLIHGHTIKATDQKAVQAVIGKHASQGINISHVLCGHIHSTALGDYCSRSSSLCGSNAYSDQGLGFASKAAQNLHIVANDGLHGVKIDLQDYSAFAGYDIVDQLMSRNVESVDGTDLAC